MADMESLVVIGTDQMIERIDKEAELEDSYSDTSDYSSLYSFIQKEFTRAKDAKRNSGIEDETLRGQRNFNGEYGPEDIAKMAPGSSRIFMNITATKCRSAASWIKDILMGIEKPFSLDVSPLPALPEDITNLIEESIKRSSAPVVPVDGQPPTALAAQESITDSNQLARDIKDAITEEIMKETRHGIKQIQTLIEDQLVEGEFDTALSQFIDDFIIFPTAIMKGPIITKRNKLKWEAGKPVVAEDYIFLNKRVSPLDFYPTPETTCINRGTVIEHIRITPAELYSLLDQPEGAGYKDETIKEILDNFNYNSSSISVEFDTSVEIEIDEQEKRGSFSNKKNIMHGLHFFGPAPAKLVREWGIRNDAIDSATEYEVVDVEAIVVGGEVIKCVINDDPLGRKPYFSASWQTRPGSFWGRSLPNLIEDIQRMCNATARALADNMGIASGPQIEIYVDRLADDAPIEEIKPFKIWQLVTDPTGAGGRAINFWQPTSNAAELLAVYNDFETKADEVTGIPRFMYDKQQGSGSTASGLAMLLDAATKTIKEAIRHIDEGLIKPRVEYQFYWNMIKNPIENFTGDIYVVPTGSQTLLIKGAAQVRRNEFLAVTANSFDMAVMGKTGRADILREIAKDLGLSSNPIPSRLILKKLEEAEAANQQAAMENEKTKGLEAAKMQIDGQIAMAQGAQAIRQQEAQNKYELGVATLQLEMKKMEERQQEVVAKLQVELQKLEKSIEQKETANKRSSAVKLETSKVL